LEMSVDRIGEPISGNLPVCAFVSSSHLFKKVDENDLALVYKSGRLQKYAAGQVIIREGDEGQEFFLLMSGTVRVVTAGKQSSVELAQLSRGAYFGEVSLLTGCPRTATVAALDEVEIISLLNSDMEGILRRYPKVRKLMQAVVEGRVRATIEKAQA